MAIGLAFENSLEKIARILARQFHIEVVFEGNEAKTDGQKISLPFFKDLTEELEADLNGYLDHETGHCKFTEFEPYGLIKNKFLRELVNATEDIRIEREMIAEFSGCAYHLHPLRSKIGDMHVKKWAKIPSLAKLIINTQWLMEGKKAIVNPDTERYMLAINPFIPDLNNAKSTREIISVCEKIVEVIGKERESEKEEAKEGVGEGGEAKGKGVASDDDSSLKSDSDKGDLIDKMIGESVGDENSEFDKHSVDVTKIINEKLKDHIKKETKESKFHKSSGVKFDKSGTVSIPITTRFDTVTNHSGKGSLEKYNILKKEVSKLVMPIRAQLERVLKVRENARWENEKEQGKLNSRSLGRMASDSNYRTVFREFKKTETNNVAVEILVDMSGSMDGKMVIAKRSAIAIAEALKALNIPFEVTGFNSVVNDSVIQFTKEVTSGVSRFSRVSERLDLHVFKDFNSSSLTGIEKLFVGSENPDGECVKWAATRLATRKEKRKILMVLSDGEPWTGDTPRDLLNVDLKNKVALIEKSGIECIGIGIKTDAVKHFYKNHVIISDLSKLPTETMKKLSKIIAN